jgi:hypothetical protein
MHAQGRFFVDVDVISDSFLLSLLSMIPRAYIPRSVLVYLSTFLEEAIFSRERAWRVLLLHMGGHECSLYIFKIIDDYVPSQEVKTMIDWHERLLSTTL